MFFFSITTHGICHDIGDKDSLYIDNLFVVIDSLFYIDPTLAEKKLDEIISKSKTNEAYKADLISAYIRKADIKEQRGDLDEAMLILKTSLSLAQESPEKHQVPGVKRCMAHIKLAWGDAAGALAELHESMKIAKSIKDTLLIGVILSDLVLVHNDLGNPQKP